MRHQPINIYRPNVENSISENFSEAIETAEEPTVTQSERKPDTEKQNQEYMTESQLSEKNTMRAIRNELELAKWGMEIAAEDANQSKHESQSNGDHHHHDDGSGAEPEIRFNNQTGCYEAVNASDELPF